MSGLYENQISKTRKIIGFTLSILASLMIFYGGFMKVIGAEEMVKNMSKINFFADKIVLVGIMELTILALYWIPRTMNIGFVLMASLTGGIIAVELIFRGEPFPGAIIAAFFYLGTFLRKPSLSGLDL